LGTLHLLHLSGHGRAGVAKRPPETESSPSWPAPLPRNRSVSTPLTFCQLARSQFQSHRWELRTIGRAATILVCLPQGPSLTQADTSGMMNMCRRSRLYRGRATPGVTRFFRWDRTSQARNARERTTRANNNRGCCSRAQASSSPTSIFETRRRQSHRVSDASWSVTPPV
jgi:hypothetical protein